jgi:carbon monoxide dehydrogenase subunit G
VKVNGTANLNAPAEQVWAALNDPAVLVRTIPGCEQLETIAADHYRMTVTAGVASIRGSYLGDVRLADHVPPSAFTLRASGAGAPGTVSADVRVTLDEQGDGSTLLSYAADAVVGGTIGGVGQRVLGGVARKLAGEFFQNVNLELTTPEAAADASGASMPAGGEPAAEKPAGGEPATGAAAGAVAMGPPSAVAPAAAAPSAPTVFTRPAQAAGGRAVSVDVRDQLPAALVGALIALVGVLVGWRIARRD